MSIENKIGKTSSEVFDNFDKNKDGSLDFDEFRNLCLQLFDAEEVEENESRIENIFEIFDINRDGLLNGEEWNRCYNEWLQVIMNPVNVLLVVDVQNDFIQGSLGLSKCGEGEDGEEVIEPINRLLKEGVWKTIVYTQDWHPENHIGFFDNLHLRQLHPESKITKEKAKLFDTVLFLEPKLEQRLWPVHCIINSWGSQLHERLFIAPDSKQVRKGQNPDMESYSAFYDNNSTDSTELLDILREYNVTDVYVCGLAYDICVRATCLDGLKLGYRLAIIEDCCRGVSRKDIVEAREEISDKGGLITDSNQVLSLVRDKKRSLIMAHQGAVALGKKYSSIKN